METELELKVQAGVWLISIPDPTFQQSAGLEMRVDNSDMRKTKNSGMRLVFV